MRITVTENGFTWEPANGPAQHAATLRAPLVCVFERLDVWREGAPYDTGAIHQIDGANYDGFEGLENIFGAPSQVAELHSSAFRMGDELRIDLLRANIPDDVYWAGMIIEGSA